MDIKDILRRAAALLEGAENYNPKSQGSVFDPLGTCFSASGLIERANSRPPKNGLVRVGGDPRLLEDAKAAVCRAVGYPHIDLWEREKQPNWRVVRETLLAASA